MRIFPLKPSVRAVGAFRHTISVPPAVEAPAQPPPSGVWVQKFDNTFWEAPAAGGGAPSPPYWNGTVWVCDAIANGGEVNFTLYVVDWLNLPPPYWSTGYLPTKMRVTAIIVAGTAPKTIEWDPSDNTTGVGLASGFPGAGSGPSFAIASTSTQFVIDLDYTQAGPTSTGITSLQIYSGNSADYTMHLTNIEFLL